MAERLEVQVGADIKQLEKGLEQSKKKLKDFEKATKGVGGKVNSNLSKGAKGMNSFGKSTANAVPAVTEFSRVIQDAPFGIQGVANNITQLTQQFGHLSTKLGGSKAALSAMLGTLSGPAGILLVISAATSLLVAFGDKLFKSSDAAKTAKNEQDNLNESLKNYVSKLSQVSQAQLKGEQNAQKEIITLNLLRNQAEDTTLSLQKRLGAVKQLKSEFPDYFKDLKNEKILNGNLESTYESLSKSIIERAKATAASNKIIKNSETLLTLQSQLAFKNNEIKKKLIQTENAERLAVLRAGKERSANNFSVENAIKLRKEYNKLLKESVKIQGQIQGIELENIDLETNISSLSTGGGLAPAINAQTPKLKQALELQRVNIVSGINKITEATELTGKKFKQAYGSAFTINTQELGQRLTEDQQFILDSLTRFNQQASQIINNNITRTFSGIGDAIGNALSGAGNLSNNLSKALLGSMGALLTQLGQMAIAVGVGLNKIKLALQSLNPAVAIAAGIGLVALGKFFSNKSASIGNQIGGGSSGGGSVSGGVSGGTTRSFGSSSSFTGSNQGFSNVVFEIKGTDLVGVLSRTLERNRNLGGSLSIG